MPTQILGLDELREKLADLPANLQRNVVGAGNRAVANALVKEVQGTAKQDLIKKAVSAQPNRRKKITRGFEVGLRKPFSAMAHWFEFGTGPRYQKTTGRYTGIMRATPWLRPALEKRGPAVEEIWSKAASRNLALQLKKLFR